MLYSPEIVKTVASRVEEQELKLVVDPVMVASSGGFLSKKGLAESIKKDLLPLAVLTTPNIHVKIVVSKSCIISSCLRVFPADIGMTVAPIFCPP